MWRTMWPGIVGGMQEPGGSILLWQGTKSCQQIVAWKKTTGYKVRTQMATDLTAALETLARDDRPWLLSHRMDIMTKVCHFKLLLVMTYGTQIESGYSSDPRASGEPVGVVDKEETIPSPGAQLPSWRWAR